MKKKNKFFNDSHSSFTMEDCSDFISEKINNMDLCTGRYNKCTTKPSLTMEPKRKRSNYLKPNDIQDLIKLRQKNLPELIRRAKLKLPLFD